MSDTVAGILSTLKDMGFSEERANKALTKTGWKGVEPAMEWLLAHPEGEDESSDEDMELQAATPAEPKKELTPEERAQKLKELEELRIKKRAEREEREKQEAIEKEKIRVREGKNLTEIKQHMADKEIKLAAEERRREKEETRLAKERVRAQIEADKMARKKKEAERLGQAPPAAAAPAPVVVSKPTEKKDYKETRIQIRLPSGSPMVQTFKVNETLAAVKVYIQMNRTDADASTPFKLMTNFPKKVFTDEDHDTPLSVLGLVPSAVIMVTKA